MNTCPTRRLSGCLALLMVVAFADGCRKPRKRRLTKVQSRQIDNAVLNEAPTPRIPINAELDGKVRLIGIDLDRNSVRPGQPLTVTWYWEALAAVEGDWKVFVHLEAPGMRTTHDHDPVGELYPIAKWKPGQIIADVQKIQVKGDFPEGTAKLMVGIFDEGAWKNRQQSVRMKVANTGAVKTAVLSDRRIEAARVTISKTARKGAKPPARAQAPPKRSPTYTAYRTSGAITLDGKLDDEGWKGIPTTAAFVAPGGRPLAATQLTRAKLAWDDANLYVAFDTLDPDIYNDQVGRDATLWKQDVVEIYLDPKADQQNYLEIQVSPTGEVFDALFTSRRVPQWPVAAAALTLSGMEARVAPSGSVNARDDGVTDRSWTVEVKLPWADIPEVVGPPRGGTWLVNLYRIDGGGPGRRGFMGAWAPAGGDFHNVAQFGRVTFSDTQRPAAPTKAVTPMRRVAPFKKVPPVAPTENAP